MRTAAAITGKTLTSSPKPAYSGGILAFTKAPAARSTANVLYTKAHAKLNLIRRTEALLTSLTVTRPARPGLIRTTSAADWATSLPSCMWTPIVAWARATESFVRAIAADGTNDSVALAQATIGVHMHEGSDVAQSAADVFLMRPGLAGLVTVREVSKASVRRIKFNFAWAFVYNTFAVLLAAGAFVNARIPPEYAGLGELVSVLPVIAAAVLMRWSRV
ncbi:hypothetical protein J3459_018645 [Metarhizium acridum]|nr:hypothetical protein J3459_018645 [Metarhizium acridum]